MTSQVAAIQKTDDPNEWGEAVPGKAIGRRTFLIQALAAATAATAAGTLLKPPAALAAVGENTLRRGQELKVGESIVSANGQTRLVLQGDGNLVIYAFGKALWSSRTVGSRAVRLILQGDGNAVLYDGKGRAKWHTHTNGTAASRLLIANDGNLKLDGGGRLLWQTKSRATTLPKGKALTVGQMLMASSGMYKAILQGDGNFVIYRRGVAKWSTRTASSNAAERATRLVHQSDGNLVLYTSSGKVKWSSGTSGAKSSHRLVMQKDGNLVLYNTSGAAIWHRKGAVPKSTQGGGSGIGAKILADAERFASGAHGGQCKTFVGNRIKAATGTYPSGYQTGFANAGARAVSASEAGPGDIIQVTPRGSTDATAEQLAFDSAGRFISGSLHTAIIRSNKGSGNFAVIDSNWVGHETIGRHDLNPQSWGAGNIIKFWRFP